MKNEINNSSTPEKIKTENPLLYYLKHIGNKDVMSRLRWEEPLLYGKVHRIDYINSFKSKEALNKCPECGSNIIQDEWGEEYCPDCGLVTRNNYPYVAGLQHDLPYGIKL